MMNREEPNIYSTLLNAIDQGEYPSGTRLVEARLANRFKVSRTPIREALNRLESHGIVSRDARGSLIIAKLDHDQLSELYDLREMLEGFAARHAARKASLAEIDVLQEMVVEDEKIAHDNKNLALANRRFHRQLHLASHNRFLIQMLDAMRRSLALLSGTTLSIEGRSTKSIAEHKAIVAALVARDEDTAEQAARAHVVNAYKTRLRFESLHIGMSNSV